jgi:hypothetical protein
VGYSGGAKISPVNSLGPLTSTNILLPRVSLTYLRNTLILESGSDALKLPFACDGMSFVTGLSSSSHYFLPPIISLTSLYP